MLRPLDTGTDADRFYFRWYPNNTPTDSRGVEPCDPTYTDRIFYNEVLCTMIASMDPLAFHPENGIDDIIVSGFSLQEVNDAKIKYFNVANGTNYRWIDPTTSPLPYGTPQLVVAGRYPTNANECDVIADAFGNPVLIGNTREGRDPFDINASGGRDVLPVNEIPGDPAHPVEIDGVNDFTELEGYDAVANSAADAEKQVGFSLFGNHKIPGTYCTGSEWTMRRVEDLVNLPNFDLSAADAGNPNAPIQKESCMPSQGLVLVEIYWEHEMLLKIPVLSPVYTAVGNQDGKMVINVWAAFPMGSVEPHIFFPTPSGYSTTAAAGGCNY